MFNEFKSAVVFLFIFLSSAVLSKDFPDAPHPFRYVNDYTHTLSSQEQAYLEDKLRQYSRETSSQIAVVMIGSTGQYVISDYAFALGEYWGIGRKSLNNGVLLLVAKNDRKVFIATGYGLEGALPDALLSRIIRHRILPQFRQENYAAGINDGLDQIIVASKGEYDSLPEEDVVADDYISFILVCLSILFVLFGEFGLRRNPAYVSNSKKHEAVQNAALLASILANRYHNHHGGFSGRFGGGSDSGGFGGGSFGGGGAGGSW